MKRQNKNSKKIASAASMLLLSTAMLGMATYAWFTMNKEVSVTNMQVKAKTDQGLLINEVATATDSNWDNSATTSQTEGIQLHATSTANTATWYAAYSKVADSAAYATSGTPSANLTTDGYKTLGSDLTTASSTVAAVAGSNALQEITFVDADADSAYDNGEGYYVKYTYYLKSSGDAITCTTDGAGKSLNIKNVAVTGSGASDDLDKSLRVAVVANNKAYIYAPLKDSTQTYYVHASTTGTTTLDKTVSQPTAITSIPSVTTDGTPVYVYLYFEGEDPELKTQNVRATLDTLTVNIDFELADNTAAVTDSGVAISN
ncbi:hypothetical protein [uncultured Eubacterium sp.]|uniref:hypothetical protein n=1 Tax=uncultured Eubacterium sp. TaxID=165185 RepID=UPI000EC7AD67|nr:hypothetical protein [uncultured Eubacterium sp.]HAH18535.1 hypothetical protein [Eubacterium sp.]